MKKTAWVLCLLPVFLFAGTLPPLSNVTIIPDFTLHDTGETKVLVLPALPDKPGVIPVLRCRINNALEMQHGVPVLQWYDLGAGPLPAKTPAMPGK